MDQLLLHSNELQIDFEEDLKLIMHNYFYALGKGELQRCPEEQKNEICAT